MNRAIACVLVLLWIGSLTLFAADVGSAGTKKPHGEHWELAGELSEACSCSVPCTCNFNQGPSPHHYCYSLFALDIEHGHYGTVQLDGLHLAGAHGKKGDVWYIDQRATPEQAAALHVVAEDMGRNNKKPVYWGIAEIRQRVGETSHELEVSGHGGFKAEYLIGMDGKTPILVENNPSWNIQHGIKAKTKDFEYHDEHGNKFKFVGVNSNEGRFDWTDQTAKYF
jgi:hypothetical protein